MRSVLSCLVMGACLGAVAAQTVRIAWQAPVSISEGVVSSVSVGVMSPNGFVTCWGEGGGSSCRTGYFSMDRVSFAAASVVSSWGAPSIVSVGQGFVGVVYAGSQGVGGRGGVVAAHDGALTFSAPAMLWPTSAGAGAVQVSALGVVGEDSAPLLVCGGGSGGGECVAVEMDFRTLALAPGASVAVPYAQGAASLVGANVDASSVLLCSPTTCARVEMPTNESVAVGKSTSLPSAAPQQDGAMATFGNGVKIACFASSSPVSQNCSLLLPSPFPGAPMPEAQTSFLPSPSQGLRGVSLATALQGATVVACFGNGTSSTAGTGACTTGLYDYATSHVAWAAQPAPFAPAPVQALTLRTLNATTLLLCFAYAAQPGAACQVGSLVAAA
jgi:hypothetical protein